nr:reverse transcriptase domain-containing protein [Tanacetum cinerariifolium]
NQQTSAVTTAMTAILKQFQATPPPASIKAVEEICVTCGGAHPYYQCLAAGGNTFPELRDNIQGYVAAAAVNYNQGNSVYRPPKKDERVEETLTDQDLAEYTIKLHINITLADALILIPKYQKMLKALLSNKERLQELANTPLNENCSVVILKKLPKKLGDPMKFLIPCGFNKLKCKALADLGASINLMPLSVWKKLGLPELISTLMTLELANRAICTPAKIARDVFVPVGKFTFLADFVIVDYESDPRVPLILGRPFLRTARALIDVHGEEMILCDEVKDDIFNPEGGNVLLEKLLDLDSTKDLHPPHHVNPLSGKMMIFLLDIESNLKEIEYLLYHDPIKDIDYILKDSIDQSNLADLNDNLADSMPEMFTDEHALDYSSPPLYDKYDDDLFEVESDTKNVYDDPFDSKGEKIKEFKLLIDELDLPSDFLPFSEYDLFSSEDFSKVDALPSTNNEDKVFNPCILIQENLYEIITRVTQDKKLAISHASLMQENFDPPLYELPFFKEVPRSKILLQFSFENEEKVFKPVQVWENWVKLSDLKQALLGRHPMLILSF